MSAQRGAYERKSNEEELRKAVRRQHCAGLSDWQISKLLHVSHEKVKRLREAMGLPRNQGGTP